MTWAEFKKKMEDEGVKDHAELGHIVIVSDLTSRHIELSEFSDGTQWVCVDDGHRDGYEYED